MKQDLNSFSGQSISGSLEQDITFFSDIFRHDVVFRKRPITLRAGEGISCCLLFFDGMVNAELIGESVIKPLTATQTSTTTRCFPKPPLLFRNCCRSNERMKPHYVTH